MADLAAEAARILRVREKDVLSLQVIRRSVDAREDVRLVYTVEASVADEAAVLRRCRSRKVSRAVPGPVYAPPAPRPAPELPPVVAGAGPAGLFAALVLALAGQRPILLERGPPGGAAENRRGAVLVHGRSGPDLQRPVRRGRRRRLLRRKLNTGTKDLRHRFILETLVSCGAPEDILIDAKPHVGTDYLHIALVGLRRRLLTWGQTSGLKAAWRTWTSGRRPGRRHGGGAGRPLCPALPAAGPLPRPLRPDTFEMLRARGVAMEAKPFAVGVRIEHRQADCDAAQYRQYAGRPGLPVSTYKLSCHLPSGRAAYSFCVCPGGQVVAAASEAERVVTNGMSEFARNRENINGALLVNVTPEDYGGAADPLAGVAFQRQLESAAYALGGGGYRAPAQRVGDFLAGPALRGPRPGGAQLPPRRHLDGPAPVSAALRGGHHRPGPAPSGPEALGL